VPSGSDERFAGYGVMGLPFGSDLILALRRFPASSIGPGYRSVWQRGPDRRWTFLQDIAPGQACSRYFGPAVAEVATATIDIDWVGPRAALGDRHRPYSPARLEHHVDHVPGDKSDERDRRPPTRSPMAPTPRGVFAIGTAFFR
jgi:hypothetical protein